MSIYNRKITWVSWKFGVLKTAMIAFGILVGSYFHEFWQSWTVALWAVFIAGSAISTLWGVRDLFGDEPQQTATG